MRRNSSRGPLLLLAAGTLVLTGCSAGTDQEQVTFYADGHTIAAAPWQHCDQAGENCGQSEEAKVSLRARPGMPVQISVPSAIGDTPWLMNVQYTGADGALRPVQQKFFSPGASLAATATPGGPGDQLVVVEVQQLGPEYGVDKQGKRGVVVDDTGSPRLIARNVWSLQVQPS